MNAFKHRELQEIGSRLPAGPSSKGRC